jgi:hypothetical protein
LVDNNFVILDTFSVGQPDKNKIRFGHSISRCGSEIYSTGYGGTYKRQQNTWQKVFTEGGAVVNGAPNNLIIDRGEINIWHYNGNTLVDLRYDVKAVAPNLLTIRTAIFRDGNVFLAGELQGTRDCIVIHGKQQDVK